MSEVKNRLAKEGFASWNRRDFSAFCKALTEFESKDIENISQSVPSKMPEEVVQYNKVFWERHGELANAEDLMKRLTRSHNKMQRESDERWALTEKMRQYVFPRYQLRINYFDRTDFNGPYGEHADRLLLYYMFLIGLDTPDAYKKLRDAIKKDAEARGNFHLLTRTEEELKKRVAVLLGLLKREFETAERTEMYEYESEKWHEFEKRASLSPKKGVSRIDTSSLGSLKEKEQVGQPRWKYTGTNAGAPRKADYDSDEYSGFNENGKRVGKTRSGPKKKRGVGRPRNSWKQ